MAEGLTNKEVATRLRLSVRTAENHVLNVMNKLGLDNRAQVAAWFTRSRIDRGWAYALTGAPDPRCFAAWRSSTASSRRSAA